MTDNALPDATPATSHFAPAASPADLPTQYDPAAVEIPTYQRWLDAGYFTADPARVLSGERKPFSIVLPPPNVTGNLHVGHALDHTMMDILARWHRMSGDEVLWLPGMDHAGIATQNVVEKQLAAEGTTRHDLGRAAFVQKVWDWKAESGGAILGQMKRLGDSVDWSRERFTLDEGLSDSVQTIFKMLFDDGLIYRANRITNWCPGCRTALSDIEVEHSEDSGELVSIRYDSTPGDGEPFSLVVATTRVETMLGDSGIAVHPDDERYAHLIGRTLTLPIVGRDIPIVGDDYVDPAFGTGAVKVTPAHDPNDFEIGRRHGLAEITVLDEAAAILGTGTAFDGMDRFSARSAIKEELRTQGRIVAEKVPYIHSVGHCSRSDDVIEPRLSLQWFVKVAPLAKAAADAVRDGETSIHPPELGARYFDWVDNMHDWTISRQLWWGHRIPIWYGPDGEVECFGPGDAKPGEGWVQDTDVLDTWFSSGLWPFSTMGWPENTDTLKAFYPTSVLVTGYDILFFWVARMMMFGMYAMKDETGKSVTPFTVVALHGMVRDERGRKMSKSRGNVVNPMDWIETYGADAVRFTLARSSNPGADQATSAEWVAGSRNFCSKLFNATRFALMSGAVVPDMPLERSELSDVDQWILLRLDSTVAATTSLLADFQFGKAAEGLYHFVWDEFCDWYLEFAKVATYSGDEKAVRSTQQVLGHTLDTVLRLLHPFIPFVTETLWTSLTGGESLVIAAWPQGAITEPGESQGAEALLDKVEKAQQLITEVRRFRSDQGIKPSAKVPAALTGLDSADLLSLEPVLRSVARLTAPDEDFMPSISVQVVVGVTGQLVTVDIDTSGTVDLVAEKARLEKDLAAAHKEIADTDKKLSNTAFTDKAPEAVVAKIRGRADRAAADIARISTRLAEMAGGTV
ncbi:valine--tRNA ligase [Nakamurella antarctica]|uniref:Valine--tRNA ligase n=1 Tax=Nakamurella antarctica TaxID=1902245 RepID=A0A3G8ZMI6_9ACTN|nr:valine--tRNA ligase [Nakamurella antarctica]AZI58463.1 valine--tRNA ligase [Nakamurella antarctica]